MRLRFNVITLGVRDLAAYRDGMGQPMQGITGQEFEDGVVLFCNMNDDLLLALSLHVNPPGPFNLHNRCQFWPSPTTLRCKLAVHARRTIMMACPLGCRW